MRPPRLAQILVRLGTPSAEREFLLGDLEEEFHRRAPLSRPKAAAWYWRQAFSTLRPKPPSLRRPSPSRSSRRKGAPMQTLVLDLKFAWRSLLRAPTFAAVVVLTLGLGIGATSAIFSLVDQVVLRPLPYDEPEELVVLYGYDRESGEGRWSSSYPDFEDFRQQSTTFESLAAVSLPRKSLTGPEGEPVRLALAAVSHDLLPMLGYRPMLGRGFSAEDDRRGAEPVVILGEGLWRTRFGSDESVLGRSISLDGEAHTVIGVMASEQTFPAGVRAWLPLEPQEGTEQRGVHSLGVVGRLKPGTTARQAEQDVEAVAYRLSELYPGENVQRGARLEPMHEALVGSVRSRLYVLFGAVAVVLLIACVNVSNLLLSRAASRRREVATRSALGAGRWQLARQFTSESLLLCAAATAVGLGIAYFGLGVLRRMAADELPRAFAATLDGRLVLFSGAVCLGVALLFGLAPLFETLRPGFLEALREGGRGGDGSLRSRRLRRVLIVAEVTLAVVLVAGAGLLLRSFQRLAAVDPGFEPRNLLAVQLELAKPFISDDWPETVSFFQSLEEKVQGLPGVRSVAHAFQHPASPGWTSSFTIAGQPEPEEGYRPEASFRPVTAGYFETAGIPLVEGRAFGSGDHSEAPGAVIVNEAFVRRHFPDRSAVGQALNRVSWWQRERETFTIVGVAADVRFAGLDNPAEPAMYFPHDQQPTRDMTLLVRTEGDPLALAEAVKAQIWQLDPSLPVGRIATLQEYLGDSFAERRLLLTLLVVFASVALLLAAVGIYGLLAYGVAQRRRELGIRMALGAQRGDVLRLVLGQGLTLAVAGLVCGLLTFAFASRVLASMLYETTAADLPTLVAVGALLLAVSLIASYLPARRATRIDPVDSLAEG